MYLPGFFSDWQDETWEHRRTMLPRQSRLQHLSDGERSYPHLSSTPTPVIRPPPILPVPPAKRASPISHTQDRQMWMCCRLSCRSAKWINAADQYTPKKKVEHSLSVNDRGLFGRLAPQNDNKCWRQRHEAYISGIKGPREPRWSWSMAVNQVASTPRRRLTWSRCQSTSTCLRMWRSSMLTLRSSGQYLNSLIQKFDWSWSVWYVVNVFFILQCWCFYILRSTAETGCVHWGRHWPHLSDGASSIAE